jgi:prepilin-type processing-associated H-X9-DG protein
MAGATPAIWFEFGFGSASLFHWFAGWPFLFDSFLPVLEPAHNGASNVLYVDTADEFPSTAIAEK